MKAFAVVGALLLLSSATVQAEVRTPPSINQRSFGALPGSPGSSSYIASGRLARPAIGSLGSSLNAGSSVGGISINPITGFTSSSSLADVPSLDALLPGAGIGLSSP